MGATVEQVFASCKYEPWFLRQIEEIVQTEEKIRARGLPKDAVNLKRLKAMGFSDKRLGELVGLSEDKVRSHRHKLAVRPVFKRIDTCAAEFASPTAYMYSTYDAENEAQALGPAEDHHPRRRAQPHRPGHRVRLLLLPCLLRAA